MLPTKPDDFGKFKRKILDHKSLPSLYCSDEFRVFITKFSDKYKSLAITLLEHKTIENLYQDKLFISILEQLNPKRTNSATERTRSIVKKKLNAHKANDEIYTALEDKTLTNPAPEHTEKIQRMIKTLSKSKNTTDHTLALKICTDYFTTNNQTGINAFKDISPDIQDTAILTLLNCFTLNNTQGINLVNELCVSEYETDLIFAICVFGACFADNNEPGLTTFRSFYESENPQINLIILTTLMVCLREDIQRGIDELSSFYHSNDLSKRTMARDSFKEMPSTLKPNSKRYTRVMGRTYNIITNTNGIAPSPPSSNRNPSKINTDNDWTDSDNSSTHSHVETDTEIDTKSSTRTTRTK